MPARLDYDSTAGLYRTAEDGTTESGAVIMEEEQVWMHALVQIELSAGMLRLWTGDGELEWNGQTWHGMRGVIEIGGFGSGEVTVSLAAVGTGAQREVWRQPTGPVPVTVWILASEDTGVTWRQLPRNRPATKGRLSRSVIIGDVFTFHVAPAGPLRRRTRRWSAEDRPAGDTSFSYLKRLSEGVEATWPVYGGVGPPSQAESP